MSHKFRMMMIMAFGALGVAAHADGIVILDGGVSDPDNVVNAPRVAADGRIFLQVSYTTNDCTRRVIATDALGTLLPTFGQGGTVTVPGPAGSIGCIVDLIPTSATTIQTLDAFVEQRDNAFVPLWTSPDIYAGQSHASVGGGHNTVFVQQPDGKWVIGGQFVENGMAETSTEWTLGRLTSTGQMDTTFAAGSVLRQEFAAVSGIDLDLRATMLSLHVLPNGQLLASGRVERARHSNTFDTNLSRYNTNGTLDFSFGVNGELRLPDSLGVSVRDPSGRVYLVGAHGHVTRLATDYSVDGTYAGGNTDANLTITDLAMDSSGRAVIFGTSPGGNGHVYIARFDTSGNADVTLNGTGVVDFLPPRTIKACRGALHSGDLPLVACTIYGVADPAGTPSVDVMLARFTAAGLLDVSFGVTQADTDQYPDAFSFADATVPFGAANVQSAPITVTGINAVANVSLSSPGRSSFVSIGCNGVWSPNGAQVSSGQTLCVRQDAATTAGQSSVLTVDIGGRVGTFTVITSGTAADLVPDAFSFPSQADVARSSPITSAAITVRGITGNSPVAIVNGSYSPDCSGSYRTSPGTITNGQTICVRHTSPNTFGTATTTTLTIGGVQGTFTSTTLAADITPDAFSFTDQIGVTPGAVVMSNALVITGLGADAPISIVGGEYSLGCNGVFTATAGTLAVGQSVCVRHTASADNSTITRTTLTIGTVSDEFTSTTRAAQGSGSSSSGGGGSLDLVFLLALLSGLVLRWSYPSKRLEADEHAAEHQDGRH